MTEIEVSNQTFDELESALQAAGYDYTHAYKPGIIDLEFIDVKRSGVDVRDELRKLLQRLVDTRGDIDLIQKVREDAARLLLAKPSTD